MPAEESKQKLISDEIKFEKFSRIPWDEFFMKIALTTTERIACRFHKVAAIFVDDDHRIISIGYNGPSVGDYNCNEVGCAKIHGDPITGELKRCRGAHAEMNAIVNSGDTRQLKNSTLYVTVFPCYDCMKVLNNLGVKKIIYLEEYLRIIDGGGGEKKVAEPESRELANKRGIILEQFRFPNEEEKKHEYDSNEESFISSKDQNNHKRF